jgi:hypothetical protein
MLPRKLFADSGCWMLKFTIAQLGWPVSLTLGTAPHVRHSSFTNHQAPVPDLQLRTLADMAHQRNQPSMGESLKMPHSVSLKVLRYATVRDHDATKLTTATDCRVHRSQRSIRSRTRKSSVYRLKHHSHILPKTTRTTSLS